MHRCFNSHKCTQEFSIACNDFELIESFTGVAKCSLFITKVTQSAERQTPDSEIRGLKARESGTILHNFQNCCIMPATIKFAASVAHFHSAPLNYRPVFWVQSFANVDLHCDCEFINLDEVQEPTSVLRCLCLNEKNMFCM